MDGFVRDLRDTLRGLRRSPGFTLVVVISLALGIGVNTAVFSLVDAVLFRPLPGVRDGAQLLSLFSDRVATPTPDYGSLSYPDYLDYRSLGIFDDLMAFMRWPFIVSGGETTERVVGEVVTGGYFSVLGTRVVVGRTLQPADARPGAPPCGHHHTPAVAAPIWRSTGRDRTDDPARRSAVHHRRRPRAWVPRDVARLDGGDDRT